MEKEELEFIREMLENQLKDLEYNAARTVSGLIDIDGYSADILDQASSHTQFSAAFRIRDRESKLMKKIKQALDRIEEGTYGICEMCEEDIAIARLKARPVAMYCIKCKTAMESFEKVIGL